MKNDIENMRSIDPKRTPKWLALIKAWEREVAKVRPALFARYNVTALKAAEDALTKKYRSVERKVTSTPAAGLRGIRAKILCAMLPEEIKAIREGDHGTMIETDRIPVREILLDLDRLIGDAEPSFYPH